MKRRTKPAFNGRPLDTTTIPQDRLNIDNKERSNLFPWNGQFSPQLVEVLLTTFAPKDGFILDPFLGSGTVLYEAGRSQYPAFGAEINPAALKMAQAYHFINSKLARRGRAIQEAEQVLENLMFDAFPLFSSHQENGNGLTDLKQALTNQVTAADDTDVQRLLETLIVLLNYGDAILAPEKVYTTWGKLRDTVIRLPYSEEPIRLANCDARALPLGDSTVDIVVTSPPYINVFNYHQQYRRSMESMGWNLLTVAKSEIGSNRKHRQNRFLTVAQYCLDMTDVFHELRRVCKESAKAIIIVGRESNVRKTSFFNGEIVVDLACRCAGFSLKLRQERVFMNRFGERIYEDILHFDVSKQGSDVELPSSIAEEVLSEALDRAPEESLNDLKEALASIGEVNCSPLYAAAEANANKQPTSNKR